VSPKGSPTSGGSPMGVTAEGGGGAGDNTSLHHQQQQQEQPTFKVPAPVAPTAAAGRFATIASARRPPLAPPPGQYNRGVKRSLQLVNPPAVGQPGPAAPVSMPAASGGFACPLEAAAAAKRAKSSDSLVLQQDCSGMAAAAVAGVGAMDIDPAAAAAAALGSSRPLTTTAAAATPGIPTIPGAAASAGVFKVPAPPASASIPPPWVAAAGPSAEGWWEGGSGSGSGSGKGPGSSGSGGGGKLQKPRMVWSPELHTR
jgi:hypothetical protein